MALVALLAALTCAPVSAMAPSEDQLKALLVYKLIKFVHWPDTAGSADPMGFQLCVMGGAEVARQLEGRRVGDTVLRVEKLSADALERISGCHLLFVGNDTARSVRDQVKRLGTRSVLLVTDARRGAERGYMVEIARQGPRMSLRINLAAARAAGLGVSASLIQVAQVVE